MKEEIENIITKHLQDKGYLVRCVASVPKLTIESIPDLYKDTTLERGMDGVLAIVIRAQKK